mmetsp:Transcript_124273/g.247694  ORF Transcript_124273/g.247694 Transcript_124273/m.247694 type:complete len:277 (-) Transcript_124273:44-874(-)
MQLRNTLLAAVLVAASVQHSGALTWAQQAPNLKEALSMEQEGVVKPFHFEQKLILCNAYPSAKSFAVSKNGEEKLTNASSPLRFKECRHFQSRLHTRDKLDVTLLGAEIHGAFQVAELPASDSVLLLVLQRHKTSHMVAFQSLAFPSGTETQEAQLAVIDAYQGTETGSRFQMEDHITGKEGHGASKRIEQLSFNRVYSIEEGEYDTSVTDQSEKKVLLLKKSRNYVILRTGEEGTFPESLSIFPEDPVKSAASALHGFLVLALPVLVLVLQDLTA